MSKTRYFAHEPSTASVAYAGSQYKDPEQYMYFKVGVYHVNNTSDLSSDTGQFAGNVL